MASAVSFGQGGAIRQAPQQYNVPLATLHHTVNWSVEIGCNPGPNPVLSCIMEQTLVEYVIEISNMGLGLTLVEQIAEKEGIDHPFRNGLLISWM